MMLHKENHCRTEKEKLLEFVVSLTQEEIEAIVANFGEIVASIPTGALLDIRDKTSQDP